MWGWAKIGNGSSELMKDMKVMGFRIKSGALIVSKRALKLKEEWQSGRMHRS